MLFNRFDWMTGQDIAKQLVHGEVGANLRVVLGGGRREFRDRTMTDEQSVGAAGARGDGRDLIREWSSGRYERNASYVWNKAQFDAVHPDETEYLLGLFGHGAMLGHLQATEERVAQPTLEEMTTKAVQLLGRNRAGYLLVVVNALIDEAHHHNWARVALDESAELDRVVASVKRLTVDTETLTVVTADHSHTLTYSGYPVKLLELVELRCIALLDENAVRRSDTTTSSALRTMAPGWAMACPS